MQKPCSNYSDPFIKATSLLAPWQGLLFACFYIITSLLFPLHDSTLYIYVFSFSYFKRWGRHYLNRCTGADFNYFQGPRLRLAVLSVSVDSPGLPLGVGQPWLMLMMRPLAGPSAGALSTATLCPGFLEYLKIGLMCQ